MTKWTKSGAHLVNVTMQATRDYTISRMWVSFRNWETGERETPSEKVKRLENLTQWTESIGDCYR